MHILIIKDSATKVPREVKDMDEARAFASQGFPVEIVNDDGSTSPLPPESAAPDSAVPQGADDGQAQEGRGQEVLTGGKPARKKAKG